MKRVFTLPSWCLNSRTVGNFVLKFVRRIALNQYLTRTTAGCNMSILPLGLHVLGILDYPHFNRYFPNS